MRKKNLPLQLIAISLAILIIIPVFICYYEYNVQSQIKQKTFASLKETLSLETQIVKANFDGQYMVLEVLASYFSNFDFNNPKDKNEIITTMNALKNSGQFKQIIYTGVDGIGVTNNNETVNLAEDESLLQSMQGNRSCTCIAEDVSKQTFQSLILRVPVYDDTKNNVKGVLSATYSDDFLSRILSNNTYENSTHFYIKNAHGMIIAACQHLINNHQDFLEQDKIINNNKQLSKEAFNNYGSSITSNELIINFKGDQQYVAYAPLEINDWFLYTIISSNIITNQNNFFTEKAVILATGFFLSGIAILFIILFFEKRKTRQLSTERELLRESEESYRIVEDFSEGILFKIDLNTDNLEFTKNYSVVYGREPKYSKFSEYIKDTSNIFLNDVDEFNRIMKDICEGVPRSVAEYRVKRGSGEYIWNRIEFKTLYSVKGLPQKVIGKISNVEEKNRKIEQLKARAETDPLTRILNREATKLKIENIIHASETGDIHAFLIMDIDNFKQINDTYGHSAGDNVLLKFAQTLSSIFRKDDIIGRIGGDEFVAFATNISKRDDAVKRAQEIIQKVELLDTKYAVSCSVGISFYSKDGASFKELYKAADTALYKAKSEGKKIARIYE